MNITSAHFAPLTHPYTFVRPYMLTISCLLAVFKVGKQIHLPVSYSVVGLCTCSSDGHFLSVWAVSKNNNTECFIFRGVLKVLAKSFCSVGQMQLLNFRDSVVLSVQRLRSHLRGVSHSEAV